MQPVCGRMCCVQAGKSTPFFIVFFFFHDTGWGENKSGFGLIKISLLLPLKNTMNDMLNINRITFITYNISNMQRHQKVDA